MGEHQNWRTELDAGDYFLHQKKTLQVADRRPVIRSASDLVGPGIAGSAIRVTDFDNLLATFNGYYSSEPEANAAPNTTDAFIGYVVMDDTLGGRQVFTSLMTGEEFTRVFLRNPSDASSIVWGQWKANESVPPTCESISTATTVVESSVENYMTMPDIRTFGTEETYEWTPTAIKMLRPGVYSGYIRLRGLVSAFNADVHIEYPNGNTSQQDFLYAVPIRNSVLIPVHFWSATTEGFLRLNYSQTTGSVKSIDCTRLILSRLGDAP